MEHGTNILTQSILPTFVHL